MNRVSPTAAATRGSRSSSGPAHWFFDRGEQAGWRLGAMVISDSEAAQAEGEAALQVALQRQLSELMKLPPAEHMVLIHEKRATFACTDDRPTVPPGYLLPQLPGVVLAGDYSYGGYPATLEGAVREKALHTMREQTQRMEGLVKQLLTLSKIEAAPTHLLNEKVDVPMMLRVVEREAQTLSQKKQTFTFEIDNGLKVSGNEDQLRSAISNLVYNAVNHTPEGTHITVRWQRVPHGAEFSVEDNGPGIAPEHIPRLTERFYRVDKARSRQTGGSGLGLAIVKHAVNHHESRLNIESTVGKGTRFSFVIPERLIAKNSD